MEICEDEHEDSVSHQQVMERVELRTAEETFRALQFRRWVDYLRLMSELRFAEVMFKDQCFQPT